MFFNKAKIGIEIRENEIRLALIDNKKIGKFSVYKIPEEILFNKNEIFIFISDKINEFHKETNKSAKEIYCILSGNEIEWNFIDISLTDKEKIHQMLKWESERYINESLENYLWNDIIVDKSETSSKLFISKIEKTIAAEYENIFNRSGLQFIGFSSVPIGMYELFLKYLDKKDCNAFVFLNNESANIIILNNGKLLFSRQTRCDLNADVSELSLKIDQSFAYFSAEERMNISSVTVTGPENISKELVEKINNSSKNGSYFDVLKHLDIEQKSENIEKCISIAGNSINTDNLIVSENISKKSMKPNDFLIRAVAVLLLIIISLFSYQKIQLNNVKNEYKNLNIKNSEITPYVKEFESYNELKVKYSSIEKDVIHLLKNKTNWHIIIEKLSSLCPKNVWITSFRNSKGRGANFPLNKPENIIRISGSSLSYEDIIDLKNNLLRSQYFKNVILQNTNSTKNNGKNIVNFSLTFKSVNLL